MPRNRIGALAASLVVLAAFALPLANCAKKMANAPPPTDKPESGIAGGVVSGLSEAPPPPPPTTALAAPPAAARAGSLQVAAEAYRQHAPFNTEAYDRVEANRWYEV